MESINQLLDIDNLTTETEAIVVASGTTAGLQEVSHTFRNDYDECIGILLCESGNLTGISGSSLDYLLGLKSVKTGEVLIDQAHKDVFKVNNATPADRRFVPCAIRTQGQTVTIQINVQATLNEDLNAWVTFLVRKTKQTN